MGEGAEDQRGQHRLEACVACLIPQQGCVCVWEGVNLPDEYEVGREEHPVREGARDERRRDHRCARRAPGRRESAQPPGRRCGVRLGERAADTPAGARAAAVGAVGSMGWGCVRAFARRRARLRNAEAQYACTR